MANLATLLEKEASAEIESIRSEAQQRASEIVAKAEEEAKTLIAQRERTAASQHAAAIVRAKSAGQLEASSLKLRAQNEGVEAAFDKAEEEIRALIKDEAKYKPVLAKLLSEAKEEAGDLELIVVNPSDKGLIDAGGAEVQTNDAVVSGVRVRGKGSRVMVENTLLGRLETLRDELASDVSKVLYGAAES